MNLKEITCGIIKNNNYIIEKDGKCLILDLSDFEAINDYIEKNSLEPIGVLLTHTHWDHLLGVDDFIKRYDIPVYIGSNRPNYIWDAGFSYTINKYGLETKFSDSINLITLDEGNHTVEGIDFEVINVPGHTSCSIVYYFKKEKWMFTGDFLFKGTIGITTTALSDKEEMKNSLNKIKAYDNDIEIYPGHGHTTTLGYEKKTNMYLLR